MGFSPCRKVCISKSHQLSHAFFWGLCELSHAFFQGFVRTFPRANFTPGLGLSLFLSRPSWYEGLALPRSAPSVGPLFGPMVEKMSPSPSSPSGWVVCRMFFFWLLGGCQVCAAFLLCLGYSLPLFPGRAGKGHAWSPGIGTGSLLQCLVHTPNPRTQNFPFDNLS